MSNEKGIIYNDESVTKEGSVNASEVTANLRNTGVVVGPTDSEMEKIGSGGDEGSLNFDNISKGLDKSGITIYTGADNGYNPDNDPHLAAFKESQKVS